MRRTSLKPSVALLLLVLSASLPSQASGLSEAALQLLNERVGANRSRFFVYLDSDSGFNHGVPSGFFGTVTKVHLDTACVYDADAAQRCADDPMRLDPIRGTVAQVRFDPLVSEEFAGINIEEPQNWGATPRGFGYDLRGATRVCFDALAVTSGPVFRVQFGVGSHTAPFVSVPAAWTPFCYELASLGLSSANLAQVHLLFTIVSNAANAPAGGTVLLDNVRFEPVPTSQDAALSFPLANQVFGVVPAADQQTGRVAIPPDQAQANLTTIYESALTLMALLTRRTPANLASARLVADSLVYALAQDNQGLPLPPAPDGSRGLHSGMFSGDVALFNDQMSGGGLRGQVRLAGFSIASTLCGTSHFCLVLDGATGGNNAFVILALVAAHREFSDPGYLDAARTIGDWIYANLLDASAVSFGGYYLGYADGGEAGLLVKGKSVENNADIFFAFTALADCAERINASAEAAEWTRRARIGGDFVMQMFDPVDGRFFAGTVPVGTPPSPGITPNGPRRGDDVINTFDFLDSQTFTTLGVAWSPIYRSQIDWRRPINWMRAHFAQNVTAAGHTFQGFNITAAPTAGPAGVAWEFTGQAVVAMRLVDALYGDGGFRPDADTYLEQTLLARTTAPFGDNRGLVAATLQDGELLPPYEQCLSTPFQCISERVGLAATTWGIFAEQRLNPLNAFHGRGDLDGNARPDVIWQNDATGQASVWFLGGVDGLDAVGFGWLLAGSDPVWRVVGTADFNGDGRPDLIWRNESNGQAAVWFMGGAFGLTMQSFGWIHATGDSNWRVVGAADFDGNGKPDVIWRHLTTGQAAVWFMGGTDGLAPQGFGWLHATGDPNWHVVGTADFDSNGKPDVIWRHVSNGQAAVWFMGGADGLSPQAFGWISAAVDPNWRVVGSADFDGNGKPDVVWEQQTTRQAAVWFMTGANGLTLQRFAWLHAAGAPGWSVIPGQ